MRTTLLPAALLLAGTTAAYAQPSPTFRPLEPGMITMSPSAAPAAQPAPAMSAPAPAMPMALPKARDGEIIDSVGSDAIPALPIEAQTENGITYLSGGIGDEEKAQLKAQENSYSLRVLLTAEAGEYVGGAAFKVKDAKDATLLTIEDAGPYVYVQLPPGSYAVEVVPVSGPGKRFDVKIPATGAIKTQLRF